MRQKRMMLARAVLIWAVVATAICVPLIAATQSPLLEWRQPIYIVAGFAGVLALVILFVQPLLASGSLPGLAVARGKTLHRWVGMALVGAVVVHVVALWFTSPPDVIDALLFASPTPFSVWGVLAMWLVFATALLAIVRRRLRLRPRVWRLMHTTLAAIIVSGSAIHAMLIEGTMETLSKALLCALAIGATVKVLVDLRVWVLSPRRQA